MRLVPWPIFLHPVPIFPSSPPIPESVEWSGALVFLTVQFDFPIPAVFCYPLFFLLFLLSRRRALAAIEFPIHPSCHRRHRRRRCCCLCAFAVVAAAGQEIDRVLFLNGNWHVPNVCSVWSVQQSPLFVFRLDS